MAYIVAKHHKRKDGTFSWRLLFDYWEEGKRKYRCIPKKEWTTLGFTEEMTKEDALVRAKQINSEKWLKKWELKRNLIQQRLQKEDKVESAFLPPSLVTAFEVDLRNRYGGRLMYARLESNWRATKRLIRKVSMPPGEYAKKPEVFYNYFVSKQISVNYAQRLIKMLNLWGDFVSEKQGSFFKPLKSPTGFEKERIADAFFDKNKSSESAPILPQDLRNLKQCLSSELYNWVFISVWFGLRPGEIDGLHSETTWKTKHEGSVEVFWVYQSKLKSIRREKRWKLIPVLYEEQREALAIIRSGNFKRPLSKTLRFHLKKPATTYGGRKGFTDLMLDKGHTLEEISSYLGHQSVDRTWRNYKDKLKVMIRKTG